MKAAGGARLPGAPGGGLGARHRRRRRSAGRCTISICAGSSSISARSVVNGAFGSDVEDTALQQIEGAEKKLYDLASAGQTEGGFKPFRAALTEATVAAEAAYHRAGQLTGVATGPVPARPAAGRPAPVGPDHPGRPAVDGQDARSPPTSASMPPRPIARNTARTASRRWPTAPWSASSRSKCRPSSSPPACSPSRPRSPRKRSARAS